jgi:hypothetical protein
VARLLAAPGASPPPTEGQLRRAVSTAYYALFHRVLRAGAERFMGPGNETRPGYSLIYRGFSHGRMKSVCTSIDAARLSDTLQRQLGTQAVGQDMRNFANSFLALQEDRHRADYDPHAKFTHSGAVDAVDQAELALHAFDRATGEEQADVLALMLVNTRD